MEDVPSLVPHLESFHSGSPYRNVPFDYDKVFRLAASFMIGDTNKILIVLDYGGTIIGFIAGEVHEILFGKARIASELAWYVVEGFRKGTGGMKLKKAFEYWAENVVKADVLHMACLNDEYGERLGKHYEKSGYKLFESTYLKELHGSSI